jgi:FkbM family methyltransferase
MIVNTRRLFARLLSVLQVNAVCDVGSMDGAEALRFRGVLERASIYAFEPNPENFRLMQADPELRQNDIRLLPFAATNYDGAAELFLVEADYSCNNPWRGLSSLYRRSDGTKLAQVVGVRTRRLDTFLADQGASEARLALWIDAEGKAYEVIEGATGVAGQVRLVHVEVETTPCIGSNQKLYPEVKELLHKLGFAELATDQAPVSMQFNALFVRRDLPMSLRWRVSMWLAEARLRRCVVRSMLAICPACVHRLRVLLSPRGQ